MAAAGTSATGLQSESRFASLSDADKQELLLGKCATKTRQATKFAISVFHEYCMTKQSYMTPVAIDTLPDSALDRLLESFYAEVRNKNGAKYSVQSLRSIRAGIQRYYSEPPLKRNINIISGENFSQSKAMFAAACTDLKRSGLGNVTHKPVINDDDMVKIRQYFEGWKLNPLVLVRKVWFDLMLFCCRRGREGLRELTKESYIIETDGSGTKYIRKYGSEITKNHREDIENSTGGVIYEEKDSELCPVKSYSMYIEKSNPNCNAMFQRPKPKFNLTDEIWFENKPLGKNTLGDMMINISKDAGLSQTYTNHSIRSTSITSLSESGFEDRKIKTVSKHKSLQSIENYASDTSLPQKRKMSEALAETLYNVKHNELPVSVSNAVAIRHTNTVAIPHNINNNNVAIPQPTTLAIPQGITAANHIPQQNMVAIPQANNVQPAQQFASADLSDIDFLDDFVLDPQMEKMLTEVSASQFNVSNNVNRESTSNRSINIQNVSGGVFNFYVSK